MELLVTEYLEMTSDRKTKLTEIIEKNLAILLFVPLLFIPAFAHTVDSIDEKYRIEIGWMNEPVVSGETNGIELYISELKPCPELDSIKCAESQEFQNGISGLDKTLKMQLVYQKETIMLPLEADHNIAGKYYAFVNPTVAGFYQANVLGKIHDSTVSLSMHPPKVDNRAYIEFPESSDVTVNKIINAHTGIIEDLNHLRESVDMLEKSNTQNDLGMIGVGLGLAGIIIAGIALAKSKR